MFGKKAVIASMLAIGTSGALASEGVNYGGPVGGTDIGNAYLPPQPGLYGGVVAGLGSANKSYGDNGKRNPFVNIDLNAGIAAAGLLYIYPVTLFGGTLGTGFAASYSAGHIGVNGASQNFRGVDDMYADILVWSKHLSSGPTGLTVKVGYSMVIPIGKYNTTDLYTPGRNTYIYIPNAAVTYLTGPNFLGDGLEFSAHVFADIAGQNTAVHYKTGTVVDLDWAISEVFGRWQAGIAGYYARQINDDTMNGMVVAPNGNRLGVAAVGPVISYNIPEWKSNVKFKLTRPFYTRNSTAATEAYILYTWAFK